MEEESTNYSTRKVGHIVIHWRIYDYSLKRKLFSIISPEFHVRGPQITKWQLIFHPCSYTNRKDAILQLQRLDKEPVVVFATWRVIIKSHEDICLCVTGNQNFFKQYSLHKSIITDAAHIFDDQIKPISNDVLYLQCQLLVSSKESNNSFKICSDISLKSLSRDLLAFYKCGKHTDFEIILKDKSIRAHKVILKARSPYFKKIFEKNSEVKRITYDVLTFNAVDKVLSYLYSGNAEFVLGKPSIAIYDCALCFGIKEVKQYYSFDDLFWESKIDVDDVIYVWNVNYFDMSSNRYINSPCLRSSGSNITVRLSLYPKGEDGNSKFLSLSVGIYQVRSHQRVLLETGIVDNRGVVWSSKRSPWIDENTHEVAFEELCNRDILQNWGAFAGVLMISVRLRIIYSEATWKTSVTSRLNTFASPNDMDHSYSHLSKDIGSLFTSSIYKDISLGTRSINFQECGFILAARSRWFSAAMSDTIQSEELSFDFEKSETFVVVLNYLFSGILKDYKPSDVTDIYIFAEELTIPTLKIVCSRILGSTLTVQNVSDVLIFSHSKQEEELKMSALKFVCLNQSSVYKQQNWQELCDSYPLLYKEAQEFKRNIDRSAANSPVSVNQ